MRCLCVGFEQQHARARLHGSKPATLPVEQLMSDAPEESETTAKVAQRVAAARELQLKRQGKLNARLTPPEVAQHCALSTQPKMLLSNAMVRLGLSARACHRVIKVARSCADLGAASEIRSVDVAEAVKLRALDRASF